MFKNYLKIALRNIIRNKTYSTINIIGLSVGIACCIVIFLFIQHELSYDRFHENADQIYRLELIMKLPIGEKHYSIIRSDIVPVIVDKLHEVRNAVRVFSGWKTITRYGNKRFEVNDIFVDPGFFDIFTFPLIRGNPKKALDEPYTVVINQELSKKYFGDDDPLGKVIRYNKKFDFKITGVIEKMPDNSHFKSDFIASYKSVKGIYGDDFTLASTYLLLNKESSPLTLEAKLPAFIKRYISERSAKKDKYFLRPLTSIHLASHSFSELEENSNIKYSYYLAILAVFIITLAVINYMNLSSARSLRRAKEVGVRKVVGAQRLHIIKQFLVESILLSFMSVVLAIGLSELLLPLFNNIVNKDLTIDYSGNLPFYLFLLGISLFVGLIAGSYPALFLSAFSPVSVLRGKIGVNLRSVSLRKVLVVFQFAISIIFIFATTIVVKQLDYMRDRNLGFEKNNIIFTSVYQIKGQSEVLKNVLLQFPSIKNVTLCDFLPGEDYSWTSVVRPEGFSEDESLKMPVFSVDDNFFETFGIEIVEGRSFTKEISTDKYNTVVLNQSAVKEIGKDSVLGKRIYLERTDRYVTVVGIVKDFHLESLHKEIGPYIFHYGSDEFSRMAVRISPDDISHTLALIEKKWLQFAPEDIFWYQFVDERINHAYSEEQIIRKILSIASFLAVIIACLGLFGLVSFAAEARTKEIGIRKVLGSSTTGIVFLLSSDFLKLVLIANVFAFPLAYYFMRRWLQNFSYRTSISLEYFLLSAGLAVVIAVLTVSYHSIKAATANPVDALRYE